MNVTDFYQKVHGNEPFLSKDAIIIFAQAFADHKFEEYKEKKTRFNSELWSQNMEQARKNGEKHP